MAFYDSVLGPLGLKEKFRNLTYRRTEEVVYLEYGVQGFGLRPADGGVYRHYEVGIEHLAFEVDDRTEVDEAYQRCVSAGAKIQSPPEEHYLEDGEDYYAFFAFDPDGNPLRGLLLAEFAVSLTPTALDNGRRSPRKLLRSFVARPGLVSSCAMPPGGLVSSRNAWALR